MVIKIYLKKKKEAHWFGKAWYSTLRLAELGWHNLGQRDDDIKGHKKKKKKCWELQERAIGAWALSFVGPQILSMSVPPL